MQKSVLMMTNTVDNYDKVGDAIRADSWYGYTDGIHTVQITYNHLIGNFHLQGTLSVNPIETDWFDIDINPDDPDLKHLYLNGESDTVAHTFTGNFTFLRAVLNRTERGDLNPLSNERPDLSTPEQGHVDKVILAM